MNIVSRIAVLVSGLAALVGCGGGPPLLSSGEYLNVSERGLPEPTVQDSLARVRPYVIGPFDRLSVNVLPIEGITDRIVQADANATISLPVIGRVDAAGKTPLELERELTARFQQSFVRDPQVTITLVEALSQTVAVEGEVTKPGIYPVRGDMSLLRSLASAEGLEEYAEDEVVVFREVGGVKYAAIYDIRGIRAGNYADPRIYGGDVVVVGEAAQERRFERILTIVPALLSPVVLLLR